MGIAIFAFVVVFLLIGSGGLLMFYREAMLQRISDVITPRPKPKTLMGTIQQAGFSLGGMVEHFERVLPKSQAEVSVVEQRLIRAGYRSDTAIKMFYGAKVFVPLVLCALALVTGVAAMNPFFAYGAALTIGFLAPDFWLGRKIKGRQHRIKRGLPDVLDLLVICIEAGLSLDQATQRTAQELLKVQPDLCDELNLVVLEQRAGRARSDAWRHLAERTDVPAVRNLVSMLVQSEQFGTSVAKTLRVHSDTMRVKRVQELEEQAAKLTIKLLFPLVLFIFPALFLVTLGPPAIMMAANMKTIFK